MPRFTLRDLFWLTLVAGMGVGCWLSSEMWRARTQLRQLSTALWEEGFDQDFARDGNLIDVRKRPE